MASLPTIKTISRENIKEAPDWIELLLAPLNDFMGAVWSALSGNLTFRQNIRSAIRELRFQTSATYVSGHDFPDVSFPHGLGVKAEGVLILQLRKSDSETPVFGFTPPSWVERNGKVVVQYIGGLADSSKYVAKFLVI